jgi:ADP-glucose pyrophosphorylase
MIALRTTPRSRDAKVGETARVLALFVREAQPASAELSAFGCECSAGDSLLESCIAAGIADVALICSHGARVERRGANARDAARFDRPEAADGDGAPFAGTADALYRNRGLIEAFAPDYALVHAGGAAHPTDYRALLDAHIGGGLGATVACVEMPLAAARDFGVVGLGKGGRVVRYAHKPAQPQPRPHDATTALVSTEVFVFDRELLIDVLSVDAADRWSGHDINRDVLPILIQAGGVSAWVLRRDLETAG